jgi:hypothetical protein
MAKKPRVKSPTSADVNSLSEELRYAGDRESIAQTCLQIAEYLRKLGLPDNYWDFIEIGRAAKKNFAQRLSTSLAQKLADALRAQFKGINPDETGLRHESKALGSLGLKKLDVNYMTLEMGLGLAISIKTINFKDEKTKRYTKNIKRVDGELRAEAQDCHTRQPYAVLAAIVLLPLESANDGTDGRSSLKHAWDVYRHRGGRLDANSDHSRFESFFIGVYNSSTEQFGGVRLFDIAVEPPDRGLPVETDSLEEVLNKIGRTFRTRNKI